MGHLTVSERIRVINIFNALPIGTKDKYQKVADKTMHIYSIEISARSVRKHIFVWQQNQMVRDKQRDNVYFR
jgi:hypothetical protein